MMLWRTAEYPCLKFLQFLVEVALLVDGVTKLTKLELQSERSKQLENLENF